MLDMKQARRSTRMYIAPDLFVRWTGILQPPIQCVIFDEGIHLSSYLGVFLVTAESRLADAHRIRIRR